MPFAEDGSIGTVRILIAHQNKKGFLKALNNAVSSNNIALQTCKTLGTLGYVVLDVEGECHDLYHGVRSDRRRCRRVFSDCAALLTSSCLYNS